MSKSALIVDDNATTRALSRRVLKNLGFTVTEAENGEHGLELARKQTFGLVLSDIRMPKLDGLQMIEELRKLDTYQTVPILVVTTDDRPKTMEQGRKAGANGWLVKPFQRENLLSLLRQLIERSSNSDH